MKIAQANAHILKRLENELPGYLYYHSLQHVLDVHHSAMKLAEMEHVSERDKQLLSTAACYHDCGFIYQSKDHEEKGCEIAWQTLPGYNYTEEQIEKICGMIMATKIPQSPKNKLEEIICDADLDYLGRDDFWEIGNKLYHELSEMKILETEEQWNRIQLSFLNSHNYFTQSAKATRQETKVLHLQKVKNIVQLYGK